MKANTSSTPLHIAVLGSGAREHALAWKLSQSPRVARVLLIPGNGGTSPNVTIDPMDFPSVRRYCQEHGVDLLVVGPEAPLAAGIVEYFQGSGIPVFGPGRRAAMLEASKVWAKEFMLRNNVATARHRSYADPSLAMEQISRHQAPLVVKYDGLAGGKGVFVCHSTQQAHRALRHIRQRHGPRAPCLVEDYLEGSEISVMGFTDGRHIRLLLPSQDHKQLLDGDAGPNTGGMGAICPVPGLDQATMDRVTRSIVEPTIRGLRREGIPYNGVIYFGLMITTHGPRLLEYNVRLGDPEAQVVLPALRTPLLDVISACMDQRLDQLDLEMHPGFTADVVLASQGYPGKPVTGMPITGLHRLEDGILVFHAGTRREGERILTAGGRVINVAARGANLEQALHRVYGACRKIHFQGMYYRKDIGRREWLS